MLRDFGALRNWKLWAEELLLASGRERAAVRDSRNAYLGLNAAVKNGETERRASRCR